MKADIEMAIARARRCIQEAEALLGDVGVLVERGAQHVGPAAEPLKEVLADLRASRAKITTSSQAIDEVFHAANVKLQAERAEERERLAEQRREDARKRAEAETKRLEERARERSS